MARMLPGIETLDQHQEQYVIDVSANTSLTEVVNLATEKVVNDQPYAASLASTKDTDSFQGIKSSESTA